MMGKESIVSVDKGCIFREVFTPESIAKNGGTIVGGVTLNDGVATFDGTTGYIQYGNIVWGSNSFSFHVKANLDNWVGEMGFCTAISGWVAGGVGVYSIPALNIIRLYAVSSSGVGQSCDRANTTAGVKDIYAVFNRGTGKVQLYVDGVVTEVSIGGTFLGNINSFPLMIGRASMTGVRYFKGTMNLVEIYDRALTASEVSLLSTNNLYSGYVKENLVMDCDYTQGSVLNKIYPDLPVTNTAVELKRGVGAEFTSSTSELDYGLNYLIGTESFTLETVVIPRKIAPTDYQAICGSGFLVGGTKGFGFFLGNGPANYKRIMGQIRNDASGLLVQIDSGVDSTGGKSVHVCLVRNVVGATNTLKIYVNGVECAAGLGGQGVSLNDNKKFVVGNQSLGSYDLDGSVKLVRLYKDKALTQNEVTRNYTDAVRRGLV